MGGRHVPGHRLPPLLGYACRSSAVVPVLGRGCRDQLPGFPGVRLRRPPGRPARVRPPVDAHRRCRVVGVPREQAHVPAEQPPPVEDPRLPAADAHPRRPGDPRRSSAQGSREALRLTCCPRRHACAGVRSSPRSSGPDVAPGDRPWCSTTSPNGPSRRAVAPRRRRGARAGFVVGRAVGNSVVRHRVTRRLRAVVRDELHRLPATADLVVRARPEAADAVGAAAPGPHRRSGPVAARAGALR